jgi:S-adenosyl-L-methionine hydrolase (adenosine-forming)
MSRPIITFTSDFGLDDWFVGVVHAVVYTIAPECRVVDLSHAVPPGDLRRGAFLLEAAAGDFPPGTVHLAVVDPGVGTARRALAVAARGQFFVGPDNGLLEWALADPQAVAYALTEDRFFRHPVSRTFHGRDVFAPVAAHLARGERIDAFGPPVLDPVFLARGTSPTKEGEIGGLITYVDRFGNALTDLTHETLARAFPALDESRIEVEVGERIIAGLARSYGDAPVGSLLAIMGSSGRLEIAQVGGDAAHRYGFGEGDQVIVRPRRS